ncbi:MAG: hypothetical protein ACP5QU_11305, partial [Anaerolineae bacterium]
KGMVSRLKAGGYLILNVPSVESLLYSASREAEWRKKMALSDTEYQEFTYANCLTEPHLMAQGILRRGGALTKHYLKEELVVLIRQTLRLELLNILKTEYDWKTELEVERELRGIRGPRPWDWLVIARVR